MNQVREVSQMVAEVSQEAQIVLPLCIIISMKHFEKAFEIF